MNTNETSKVLDEEVDIIDQQVSMIVNSLNEHADQMISMIQVEGDNSTLPVIAKSHSNLSMSRRADLQLPVCKIRRKMKSTMGMTIRKEAAVYMAGVMEYVAAEVLASSGDQTKGNGRVRVMPRDIKLAVGGDEELGELFKGHICGGGVLPGITEALLKVANATKQRKPKPVGECNDA